jgi:omega-6 fatty acid desaturase (delta-12 desaturase)
MSLLIGWDKYLLIQLPLMWLAGSIGIWMFYVQHQFENVYWVRDNEWNYADSAMKGASFYKLPGILNWFSGNIGFHHIHHLSPRIPNYYLQECYNENPSLQIANMLTPRTALETLKLRLWDEETQRLIGLKEVKARFGSTAPAAAPTAGSQPSIKLGKTSRV